MWPVDRKHFSVIGRAGCGRQMPWMTGAYVLVYEMFKARIVFHEPTVMNRWLMEGSAKYQALGRCSLLVQ